MSTLSGRNPFPAEAVATYPGRSFLTSENLGYMLGVQEYADAYIKNYFDERQAAGASIGVAGPYGSGKTHILMWLSQFFDTFESVKSRVVYAKCDTPNVIDIYKQVMAQLTRDQLIELVQLALLKLARDRALTARLTESVVARLETAGALTQLDAEQNIDLEQLRQELVDRLQTGSLATRDAARALLDLADPVLGQDVYAWLALNPTADTASLGLQRAATTDRGEAAVDSDLFAIMMVDLIASLHREAGVPFIFLMDQLEVLLHAPVSDVSRIGSTFKKLIEQLNAQSAFVVIAGTPAGWDMMPQDVFARFRTRAPIPVGCLNKAETEALISAYDGEESQLLRFADQIRLLSGGSPREILRISYRATEIASRSFFSVSASDITVAADQAGSIADQARAALVVADKILSTFGLVSSGYLIGGIKVDRVVETETGEGLLALLLVTASDSVQEIDGFRNVAQLGWALDQRWPNAECVTLAIGYSSSELGELGEIAQSGRVLRYDDPLWASRLQEFASQAERRATQNQTEHAPNLLSREDVDRLMIRLNKLEAIRLKEQEIVTERFNSATSQIHGNVFEGRQIQTRVEIEDALDSLAQALERGEIEVERATLRSILIANERQFKDQLLSDIGKLYREYLTRAFHEDDPQAKYVRRELIYAMNRQIDRAQDSFHMLTSNSFVAKVYFVILVVLTIVSALWSSSLYNEYAARGTFGLPTPVNFVTSLPYVAAFGLFLMLNGWLVVWLRQQFRRRILQQRLQALRDMPLSGRLEESYPQHL